jgi:hypothetical protein
MTDLHKVVVNDVRQMVGREPVILHDHLVVDCAVVENNLPVDDVLKLGLASGHFHSHNEALSASFALLYFFFRQL